MWSVALLTGSQFSNPAISPHRVMVQFSNSSCSQHNQGFATLTFSLTCSQQDHHFALPTSLNRITFLHLPLAPTRIMVLKLQSAPERIMVLQFPLAPHRITVLQLYRISCCFLSPLFVHDLYRSIQFHSKSFILDHIFMVIIQIHFVSWKVGETHKFIHLPFFSILKLHSFCSFSP